MSTRSRIFNVAFLFIIVILVLMSVLALVEMQWNLSSLTFSFSPKGISFYLSTFGTYKELFAGTIATIAAYFGLLRLHAATDANLDKIKHDRYADWKTVLDIRFIQIEKSDPAMKREFIRIRYNFFQMLYDRNFSIVNIEQLRQVYQSVFQPLVPFFEENNETYFEMGAAYPNNQHSYSFDSFRYLFTGSLEVTYEGAVSDLFDIYLLSLSANRLIDPQLFQAALQNRLRR